MSWSPLDEKNPSDDALIGDEPFDLVADCFRNVSRSYERDLKRKPSLRELIGTVQAVLEAQLQDHTSDGESVELAALTFKTRKIPKRQKYAKGDILKALAANGEPVYGRVFDPELGPQWKGADFGPFVGVYDSLGMDQSDLDAIIQRPLIVKVFPIHRENLEKREWLVIGNRPLTKADRRQPNGPLQIAGSNEQLEAANYYYGLGPKTFHNIEDCLVRKKGGG
jgi:Immunity protein 26